MSVKLETHKGRTGDLLETYAHPRVHTVIAGEEKQQEISMCLAFYFAVYHTCSSELQITVGHQTVSDLNQPMSDEILTLIRHYVRTNFFYQTIS